MGIVIVTGDGPEHKFVANALSAQFEIDAILVCDPARPRSLKAMVLKSPLMFVDKLCRKLFLTVIRDGKAREQSISRVLGHESDRFLRQDLVSAVGRPKSGVLASKVADLKPDLLLIYGTSIIPDAVLDLPSRLSLNMHTGLSPDYRGVTCAFWPIRDGRPDMVGATVHECTSDIDGGRIFSRKAATLKADDDLHAVFARAVIAGASAYVDVVREFASGDPAGESQDLSLGQEFRGSQIGIRSELSTRLALSRLRRANRLQSKAT